MLRVGCGATFKGALGVNKTMSEPRKAKVAIIGSGPAGLTAAIYAGRANLSPVMFTGVPAGGQLMITSDVDNFPGFPQGVMGPELMDLFRKQAERFGAVMLEDDVAKVDFSHRPFRLEGGSGEELRADAIIVATGASALWLDVPGEAKYQGKGVSACATCDGFFFKGKNVYVVGGGDTAMEESTFLTKFASQVTLVHRRDSFRASKIMQDKVRSNPKIKIAFNTVVEEVVGNEKEVTGLKLRDVKEGRSYSAPVDGLFIAIGHRPNTDVFKGHLDLDAKGYLKLHNGTYTNVEGIFGCGDVSDPRYRQAVTAAGMGCMAAMDAEKWLESLPDHH